jgi:hypothetical protein
MGIRQDKILCDNNRRHANASDLGGSLPFFQVIFRPSARELNSSAFWGLVWAYSGSHRILETIYSSFL